MIILFEFVATSDTFQITHLIESIVNIKIMISAALNQIFFSKIVLNVFCIVNPARFPHMLFDIFPSCTLSLFAAAVTQFYFFLHENLYRMKLNPI